MNKIKFLGPFAYLLLQVDCDPSILIIKYNNVFIFPHIKRPSSQGNNYFTEDRILKKLENILTSVDRFKCNLKI